MRRQHICNFYSNTVFDCFFFAHIFADIDDAALKGGDQGKLASFLCLLQRAETTNLVFKFPD